MRDEVRNKLKKRKTEDDENDDLDEKTAKNEFGKRLVQQKKYANIQNIIPGVTISQSVSKVLI